MTYKILLSVLMVIIFVQPTISDEYTELIAYRDALKEQIAAVESETIRCEKSLKGWKTATIIGGVGAVASGIGIIAQKNQIDKNQKALNQTGTVFNEANDAMDFIKKVKE